MKELAELFFVFARIGALTYGGGYAILPVLEKELIIKKKWITMEEVMDYYTIGQVTPGVIAVNTATFIGYKRKGIAGGIIATLGLIFPSFILISFVAVFLTNYAEIPAVRHAFGGIRIAVGALIADTIFKMIKGIFKDFKAPAIFVIVLGLSAVLSASPVLLVTAAGAAGFLLYRPKKDRGNSAEKPL
ncbi:MAG: chromate transporter [Treponema sp.]|jgi:chromate transporter|nr:chromate transporter [Treponema sp.]